MPYRPECHTLQPGVALNDSHVESAAKKGRKKGEKKPGALGKDGKLLQPVPEPIYMPGPGPSLAPSQERGHS